MSYLIDPLHFCIALAPLSLYLLVIGILNLTKRPTAISGAADSLALGLGLSGFMLVGPMTLFLPSATAFLLGGWVWLLLLACYGLVLNLYVLLSRPRIVIYNLGPEQVRAVLSEVFNSLDPEVRWAGEAVFLPNLGVQLHIDIVGPLRNVQLVATGVAQSFEGWTRLRRTLVIHLRQLSGVRSPHGVGLVLCAILLITTCGLWAMREKALVAQSFHEMVHPGE